MSRLVFLTQSFDPAATILGVTRDWVAALAQHAGGVDVVALSVGAGDQPPGVRAFSLGKERSAGRLQQTAALYRALARTVPGATAVFVHMVPRLALLAWPAAAACRCPIALWYAQGGIDSSLRVATRLASWILTPTRGSFPLSGPGVDAKVVVTGHGIDTTRWTPTDAESAEPGRLLAAGRLSPSKRYDLLIESVALLRSRDWRLRIVGGPLHSPDRAHAEALRSQVQDRGLSGRVELAGPVSYERMAGEYRAAWALAHTSATGSLDKVVLEAMACGTPVVSTAPSSRVAFGSCAAALWCDEDRPETIAARLDEVLAWTPSHRSEVGAAVREQVEREHSLAGWANRVATLLSLR
jgi:glycosyltransferase involved in cell wall biosynthesis